LLALLDIQGLTVTIDAIGCQKTIVEHIVMKNKADYVIGLKGNQSNMHQNLSLYAQDCVTDPQMLGKYTLFPDGREGSWSHREAGLLSVLRPELVSGTKDWKKLNSLVMVKSKREVIGQEPSQETRYYISSLTDVEKAAKAIRSHWGIENKLHWTLDVLMSEDDWMTKIATIAANLATIRKLALNFLRKAKQDEGEELSGPMLMYRCGLHLPSLEQLLFGQSLDQILS
jgi:predicted transposase YbfD/YdcC